MTVSVASFRASFPEFGNTTQFPDSIITYYLALSGILLNQRRWGIGATVAVSPPTTMYDIGTELFVAHHIAVERAAMDTAANDGIPGVTKGPTASESVGPVSISYSPGDVIEPGAGHWNLTVYGLRFIKMARFQGAGPIQVGVGCGPPYSGMGWSGPLPWPGWSN